MLKYIFTQKKNQQIIDSHIGIMMMKELSFYGGNYMNKKIWTKAFPVRDFLKH